MSDLAACSCNNLSLTRSRLCFCSGALNSASNIAAKIASRSGLAKCRLQDSFCFGSNHRFVKHSCVIAQQSSFSFDIFNSKTDSRKIYCALTALPCKDFSVRDQICNHNPMNAELILAGVCEQMLIFEITQHSAVFEPPHRFCKHRCLSQARATRLSEHVWQRFSQRGHNTFLSSGLP
jgi:hypothetical protein